MTAAVAAPFEMVTFDSALVRARGASVADSRREVAELFDLTDDEVRGVEQDGLEGMFSTIFDQILAYGAGKPINVGNPEALDRRPAGAASAR